METPTCRCGCEMRLWAESSRGECDVCYEVRFNHSAKPGKINGECDNAIMP